MVFVMPTCNMVSEERSRELPKIFGPHSLLKISNSRQGLPEIPHHPKRLLFSYMNPEHRVLSCESRYPKGSVMHGAEQIYNSFYKKKNDLYSNTVLDTTSSHRLHHSPTRPFHETTTIITCKRERMEPVE
jgi:hypothetical protein